MTRIGEIDELNAKIKEQLAVMLEKRREQDAIPTESKVQCLENALNMTLGDISKLQQEFQGHHGEHHENFANHTHPDLTQLPEGGHPGQVLGRSVKGLVWIRPEVDKGDYHKLRHDIAELKSVVEKQAYVIDVLVNAVVGPMTGHDLKALLSETEDGVITSEDLLKWVSKDLLKWEEK